MAAKKKPASSEAGSTNKRKGQPSKVEASKKTKQDEEPEEEEEGTPATLKLTQKALENHEEFIKSVSESKPDLQQFQELLQKADNNMVMRLWKHFETSRLASQSDEEYRNITKGTGGTSKKKELLRGWVVDGGKTAKHFKETCQSFSMKQSQTQEGQWLSKKQILDAIGPEELKLRVLGKTIETRRNKEDPRFWELKLKTEKDQTTKEKNLSSRLKSNMASSREEMLEWEQMMGTPLEAGDFDLVQPAASSSGQDLEDDLAKSLGLGKVARGKNQEKEEGKWEKESKVTQNSTQSTMEKQLLKFKAELAKEENLLETILVDAKGASMEQKKKQGLNKPVKEELKQVSKCKGILQALLGKKSLKMEDVKEGLQQALASLTSAKKVRAISQKTLKEVIVEEEWKLPFEWAQNIHTPEA